MHPSASFLPPLCLVLYLTGNVLAAADQSDLGPASDENSTLTTNPQVRYIFHY
jgi:hypothetical protein